MGTTRRMWSAASRPQPAVSCQLPAVRPYNVCVPLALHRQVGQLVVVGFDGKTLPAEIRALASEFDLGGIILFARNVEAPEQVAGIAVEAQQLARDLPLWVGVDQEGGRVARMRRPLTEWPPMATLGRSGDEALASRFAGALARELLAVGVSIDFAPVLDVLTNPKNPAIGDRALGDGPDVVARLGAAIVQGFQSAGLAACGKHFPGHGDTGVDSHLDLPLVEHAPDRLQAVDFVPFRAAIEAGVAAIMTGHLLVPSLDEANPATLSHRIVTDVLRGDLGFDGLVFTDDLDMKAISGRITRERAAVAAIRAGCDVALLCGRDTAAHASAIEALVRAVEQEDIPRTRVEDALAHQRRAKERFASMGMAPLDRRWRPRAAAELRALVGCDAHQAVADEMRRFA
jgi:beta-N-acetylhexosaminidase